MLSYAETLNVTGSQVELLTVKKNHGTIQGPNSEGHRFQRVDIQNQVQMSKVTDSNHGNPEWNPCNSFSLSVSSEMLQLGHDCEQMIKMSIWQKTEDGSCQELGFQMISVSDLHTKYYSVPKTAEVEFPVIMPGTQPGSGSPSHQILYPKFRESKKCSLITNVKFDGDWSEHLEVLNLQKIAELKESRLKNEILSSGTFEVERNF
jgi:hypothetical protein